MERTNKKECPKCGSNNVEMLEIDKYDPQNIFGFTIADYAKLTNRRCINCRHEWRELKRRKKSKNNQNLGRGL